jgi:hypothetical protein
MNGKKPWSGPSVMTFNPKQIRSHLDAKKGQLTPILSMRVPNNPISDLGFYFHAPSNYFDFVGHMKVSPFFLVSDNAARVVM